MKVQSIAVSVGVGVAIASMSGCGHGDRHSPPPVSSGAGFIKSFQIISSVPAFNGATPAGAAGPYQVITAVVHGELDPNNPLNADIVNIKNAPVGSDGDVAYSTDVVILRPQSASTATRVLFYDVVNRGSKLGVGSFVGGGALDTGAAPPSSFPSLLRNGYTILWSGWQGDIPLNGSSTTAGAGLLGVTFPVATNPDGTPITAMSREEFIPDYAGGSPTTIPLTYPPTNLSDTASVTFTARQSWLTAYGSIPGGVETYTAPSQPVATWRYISTPDNVYEGNYSVSFTPPASVPGPNGTQVSPDAGTIYSFVYRAAAPTVDGIGFAALRDLVSFLRYDATDAQGVPNPLDDLKNAACVASSCSTSTNFDIAIGEGISQSGRFMKDFLYQGFNVDSNGKIVFDGMFPIISAARRTWTNADFAQPGRWSKQHEDHFMPGFQFPFTYATTTDPVSGATDGILKQCTATNTCPKIMQLDGAFEWWGGAASLVVTDGRGNDIQLPQNVRYYLVPGTQHGGGSGVTTGNFTVPAAGSQCQLPGSPVEETPVERALIPALVNWIGQGTPPPASQYPTVASGTLVEPTQIAVGFPSLTNVKVPSGAAATPTLLQLTFNGEYNQLFVTDFSNAVPVVNAAQAYTILVPSVDSNGNETSGVLVPDVSVPLATYTGWNYRGAGHAIGDGCISNGSAIPLAVNAAAQAGGTDTRATLATLYGGSRSKYQAAVAAAANALVSQGYLLQDDANNVFIANAGSVSATLLPQP
ncbi:MULTISPECIES: alpha/beta hydrolase domain-containing protein [Paraburkholderia]|uniref:alpha/beta hydrolase domain-containing protein n=1 Tax=Paraburkholderia TaxID=1822464 RepID=UPI00225730E9|nr:MULTISPECIES: alpha/beta hydrolase domain-containing protein [Paraburkholderia]MCX4162528.1 alpha/beta hydrolase domain-containing protein [Paraburkholderia megapolitana]MDN7158023.1 peptidase [Paraburkholderia sp. CHISQ3]MDQ6495070.1 alpha/beta hydrolase domain-containing protein [Paraburkholderia megapolitana]